LKIVGYFRGFSSPSVSDKQHHTLILTQVVGRRTDEVADVLYEKEIQLIEIPVRERILDHRGFQVAKRAGRDLLDWSATATPSCSSGYV